MSNLTKFYSRCVFKVAEYHKYIEISKVHAIWLHWEKERSLIWGQDLDWWRTSSKHSLTFNMSSLTNSYIVFTLKMESVSKNRIFGLKMMVKSGLEKYFLNSSKRETTFPYFIKVPKITNSVIKGTIFPHGISKYIFLVRFHHHFWAKNCIFGYRFYFEGKKDISISQVERVK